MEQEGILMSKKIRKYSLGKLRWLEFVGQSTKEEAKQKKMQHRNLESLAEHKAAHIKYDIP